MCSIEVKIHRLPHAKDLPFPSTATVHSAGLDIRAAISSPTIILAGKYSRIPTGLILDLQPGVSADVRGRSGLGGKGIIPFAGLIDSDYRGEIFVILYNFGPLPALLLRGDRIAQLVFCSHISANLKEINENEISNTQRGAEGFGSTGIN